MSLYPTSEQEINRFLNPPCPTPRQLARKQWAINLLLRASALVESPRDYSDDWDDTPEDTPEE